LPIGGGGPRDNDTDDAGLWIVFKEILRRFANEGMALGVLKVFTGPCREDGVTAGAGAAGGLGAVVLGG
jgi:hypothetical protein